MYITFHHGIGTRSNTKLKVSLKGVSLNRCIDQYGNLSSKQICAGEENKDVCNGNRSFFSFVPIYI